MMSVPVEYSMNLTGLDFGGRKQLNLSLMPGETAMVYVDQEDLDRLLSKPTKATATDCFCRQIEYWFNAGTEDFRERSYWDLVDEFPKIEKIAERHRITYFWEGPGPRRKL